MHTCMLPCMHPYVMDMQRHALMCALLVACYSAEVLPVSDVEIHCEMMVGGPQ